MAAAVVGFVLGGVIITENGLHIYSRPVPNAAMAESIARETLAIWEPARVVAHDGTPLQGWLFTPGRPNGGSIILLHGVGDTREGMLAVAPFLLRAGYTLLIPDFRGHGSSGGTVISYGRKEAGDVHDWCDWLLRQRPGLRLYGMGRSMGAAILLQSLPCEPRFRAVIAECPFFNFEEIAYYRLEQRSHVGRVPLWPVIHFGFAYAQLRYGVDLYRASPADAVGATRIPVLLIHGTSDSNIPCSHSERLHALNPGTTQLWLVPGAGHLNAMDMDRGQYVRKVLDWFQQ